MKTKTLVIATIVSTSILFACNSSKKVREEAQTEVVTEKAVVEEAETSMYGVYTLTDMIPVTGDKELKQQDIKYIDQSKARTLNKTELTLNEDGTFTRVFPSPREDGTINTWTGTHNLDEENNTLKMNVSFKGRTMDIEFKVLENTGNKLSLVSSFGQIEMNYVYTK